VHEELLVHYNRELTYLRQLSREFAEQFPKVAGRLLMEGEIIEDPHAERLMEAFAFLTARIHNRLDDEFPEITDALLGILYPHYLRPIPSMSIVQFQIDPDELHLTGRHTIPRHRELYSQPVNDLRCRFRTCYPVDLWPVRVAQARLEALARADFALRGNDAVAAITLSLQALGGTSFGTLGIDRLRFFLDGEPPLMHALYEILFTSVHSVRVSNGAGAAATLPAECILPVGFEQDEGLLDYDARSLLGYRLLQEYFCFPEKFMFFDLDGLTRAVGPAYDKQLEITIYLRDFERRERLPALAQSVGTSTFRLGCTPVVNLFRQNAEPLIISHRQTEYQVIADVRRPWGLEIYSVDSVRKLVRTGERGQMVEYRPFYSLRHTTAEDQEETFWHATRRPSPRRDDSGTEVYLSLVDLRFDPALPPSDALTIAVTCLNRDLPALLPFGGDQGDLEVEGEAPVSRIRCLRKPTATLRPPRRKGAYWRLISHLSLNHLSIVEDGREALLEILSLYNFSDSPALRKQIGGIVQVAAEPTVAKIGPPGRQGFVRGTAIRLVFDEEEYVGAGVYLLAAVLERFFALYSSINSFTQLTVNTRQREKALAKWRPRAGKSILV
jgi:type VI secretion system protein ImpG